MALVLDLPKHPLRIWQPFDRFADAPPASGREGQELHQHVVDVFRNWTARVQTLRPPTARSIEMPLNHVPFEPAGTIRVRFQQPQSLPPRKLTDLEEE